MSDKMPEFSQHMLEGALEGVTTRILDPLEISVSNEPRALSEISELSSPSELSDLSTASQLSPEPELSELFYSPVPREPTVPVLSSALTQPSVSESSVPSLVIASSVPSLITESLVPSVTESSVLSLPSALTLSSVTESSVPSALTESLVPSMPSALTEPSLESVSLVSSSKCHLNTVEQSIHTESRLIFNCIPVETSTSPNKKKIRLTTTLSSGLTEINGECDLTKIPVETSTSSNKKETRLTTMPSSGLTEINGECDLTKAFGNEPFSTQQWQSLPVHNSINDYVDDYQNYVYGTPYFPKSFKCTPTYRPTFLKSKHRPSGSTSLFNSRELFIHMRNVSEKQKLFKKLDTSDKVFDDGGVLATSSPHNTSMESPADNIVNSVGHGQYIPPLSTNELYPGSEVVDNIINETMSTESENQLSSSKELNDGSIAMDSSTKSFESSYEYCNDNESSCQS